MIYKNLNVTNNKLFEVSSNNSFLSNTNFLDTMNVVLQSLEILLDKYKEGKDNDYGFIDIIKSKDELIIEEDLSTLDLFKSIKVKDNVLSNKIKYFSNELLSLHLSNKNIVEVNDKNLLYSFAYLAFELLFGCDPYEGEAYYLNNIFEKNELDYYKWRLSKNTNFIFSNNIENVNKHLYSKHFYQKLVWNLIPIRLKEFFIKSLDENYTSFDEGYEEFKSIYKELVFYANTKCNEKMIGFKNGVNIAKLFGSKQVSNKVNCEGCFKKCESCKFDKKEKVASIFIKEVTLKNIVNNETKKIYLYKGAELKTKDLYPTTLEDKSIFRVLARVNNEMILGIDNLSSETFLVKVKDKEINVKPNDKCIIEPGSTIKLNDEYVIEVESISISKAKPQFKVQTQPVQNNVAKAPTSNISSNNQPQPKVGFYKKIAQAKAPINIGESIDTDDDSYKLVDIEINDKLILVNELDGNKFEGIYYNEKLFMQSEVKKQIESKNKLIEINDKFKIFKVPVNKINKNNFTIFLYKKHPDNYKDIATLRASNDPLIKGFDKRLNYATLILEEIVKLQQNGFYVKQIDESKLLISESGRFIYYDKFDAIENGSNDLKYLRKIEENNFSHLCSIFAILFDSYPYLNVMEKLSLNKKSKIINYGSISNLYNVIGNNKEYTYIFNKDNNFITIENKNKYLSLSDEVKQLFENYFISPANEKIDLDKVLELLNKEKSFDSKSKNENNDNESKERE